MRRLAALGAGAALLAVVAVAPNWLKPEPPPDVRVELLHPARLVDTAEGRALVFDRAHLPIVRIPSNLPGQWTLRWRGAPHSKTRTEVRDGWRLLWAPPPSKTTTLLLEKDERVVRRWRLDFAPAPDEIEPIAEARRAIRDDAPDLARRILTGTSSSASWAYYLVLCELGRLQRNEGRPREAESSWTKALHVAEALQSPTERASRLRALAFLDLQSLDLRRAKSRLQEARDLSSDAHDEDGLNRSLLYEGLLLQRKGASRLPTEARRLYQSALHRAWTRGSDGDAQYFAMQLATLLAEHGSYDDAVDLFERYLGVDTLKSLDAVDVALHRGYVERVAYELGIEDVTLKSARGHLQLVLSAAREAGRARQIAEARAELLILEADAGETDRANTHLAALETLPEGTLEVRRWEVPLVALQLEVAQRPRRELLTRIATLEEKISKNADAGLLTALYCLRGELLHRLGDNRGAQDAFREALETADHFTRALAQPRARMLHRARRRSARQGLLQALLQDSEVGSALAFQQSRIALDLDELGAQARAAHWTQEWSAYQEARDDFAHRHPRGCDGEPAGCQVERERLEQRLDTFWSRTWSPPNDDDTNREARPELSLPKFDEETLILVVARISNRWASFLVREGRVEVRYDDSDPVRPWLQTLDEARRVYVVPGASSHAFDLSARTSQASGRAFGLDHEVVLVPHLGLRRTLIQTPPEWLVVADPNDDLPIARRLGGDFDAGPSTRLLGSKATQAAVSRVWPSVRWILFAGHGHTHDRDPWRARLQLNERDQLALEDLLVTETRADLIVLAGCRTGPHLYQGEIGLPQVLLVRGANSVLATTTLITDATAHRFVTAFVESGATKDAPSAFRSALERVPHAVSSFRLWARLPSSRSN